MSDTSVEVGKVYEKIDQVLQVVTDTRLELEKLRGETKVSITELSAKVGPMGADIANLKMRVDALEGQAKFNAGRKLAWAGLGGTLIVLLNISITLVKAFVLQ